MSQSIDKIDRIEYTKIWKYLTKSEEEGYKNKVHYIFCKFVELWIWVYCFYLLGKEDEKNDEKN